jgi:hypothetical protein
MKRVVIERLYADPIPRQAAQIENQMRALI